MTNQHTSILILTCMGTGSNMKRTVVTLYKKLENQCDIYACFRGIQKLEYYSHFTIQFTNSEYYFLNIFLKLSQVWWNDLTWLASQRCIIYCCNGKMIIRIQEESQPHEWYFHYNCLYKISFYIRLVMPVSGLENHIPFAGRLLFSCAILDQIWRSKLGYTVSSSPFLF